MNKEETALGKLYDLATGDEDARVCKDIPEESCHEQPHNYSAYLVSNVFTKIADELCSARLVFPWLIGALGAPAAFAGFLVPIREAGVLLPQLVVAALIRKMPVRKWVWVTGGLLSAIAIAFVLLAVETVEGVAAGWTIILLLSIYSLARGICSVSAKDVLGKTISKSRRGSLMGLSAGISGGFVLLIGLTVQFGGISNGDQFLFRVLLAGAVLAYVASLIFFAMIRETPGATSGGANAISEALGSLQLVITDKPFRQFMMARTLLLSIALAPPFYVLLAQQKGIDLAGMGLLIVASGVASMVSGPVWGKMSDRSSRRVMALTSVLSGIMGIAVYAMESFSDYSVNQLWHITLLFFLIAVFHGGARLGRKTYLVDMANSDNRSTYVAVSNTLIGVFMLAGGAIGVVADLVSVVAVLGLLGVISVLSSLYIATIRDVSAG